MAKLDMLIKAWSESHREFAFAFEGLSDEDLWKRPHPRLLSIGELAGHVSYWEATGHIPAESPNQIGGILVDPSFRYYTIEVDNPVELSLTVQELKDEVTRVHEQAKAAVIDLDPEATDLVPGEFFKTWTWGYYLQYRAFHASYHTGQAYSVRHLLGHTTTDN